MLLGRKEVDDGCAAGWWETPGVLGGIGESMTVEWERGGLLGGRGLCCWAGKRWTMVALLGGRGQEC